MSTWRERVSTRSVYEATDFDEVGIDENVIVCLPRWSWYVARSFLFDYGQRRTSFSLDNQPGKYLVPDDAQWDVISDLVSKGSGACIMATCEEIVEAIQGISTAIVQSDECCEGEGSGGAGAVEEPEEEFEDEQTETSFPEYFDTREDYINKKCGIARLILANILEDLGWIEAGTLVTITVSAFVVALLTPVPGDEVIGFVGMILSLFIQGVLVGIVSDIQDAIEADIEGLVCAMVEAGNSQDAQTDFRSLLGLSGIDEAVFDFLVNNDSFNRLFSYGNTPLGYADCDCNTGGWCGIIVTTGTIVDEVPGFSMTIQAEQIGGFDMVQWELDYTECPGEQCQPTSLVSFDLTGWTERPTTSYQFQIQDVGECGGFGTSSYQSNDVPADNTAGGMGRSNFFQMLGVEFSGSEVIITFVS
ncbi:MAG: hypothetical protein KAJ19_19490 [Gammaproteobacteria bacterium]|nr:hypothetical protein [Gammaproteobacteria bacterium]